MSAGFVPYKREERNAFALLLRFYPAVVTIVVAFILSGVLVKRLESRLRPVLLDVAQAQVQNTVTVVMEQAVLEQLEQHTFRYSDLVNVERAQDGTVTAITTDMTAMNQLRGTVMDALLMEIAHIDEGAISIPLGSLADSELLWGRGPSIKVRSFTVGTVQAEFESEFASAGINQTLHKIWLRLCVPVTILLPGTRAEVTTQTRLCVAETVIVGKVPSYVQKAYG